MRMDRLLADLEAAADAQAALESRAEVAQGVRAERAQVTLADRLRAAAGRHVVVTAGSQAVAGVLLDVGEGWIAIGRRGPATAPIEVDDLVNPGVSIVALEAVSAVTGLGHAHRQDTESSIGRSWGSLLRAVARSRVPVVWHVRAGAEPHIGTIEAVGADHVLLRVAGSQASTALALTCLARLDVCAPGQS